MSTLIYILLCRHVTLINSQQHVVISPDKSHPLDIEPLIINIRISDIDICQRTSTADCKSLIDQLFECQQIIFNDPGFSYQQYKGNIAVHREILVKYQTMCDDTASDDLVSNNLTWKKINPLSIVTE